MKPKKIFIKVSGDITEKEEFRKFAIEKAKTNHVVVVCGAGKKINKAFEKVGLKIKFGPHGRITGKKGRALATKILTEEKEKLDTIFVGTGVVVEIPVYYIGGFPCHMNGDDYTNIPYLDFDEIYVFTLQKRLESKKQTFKRRRKIKVIGV